MKHPNACDTDNRIRPQFALMLMGCALVVLVPFLFVMFAEKPPTAGATVVEPKAHKESAATERRTTDARQGPAVTQTTDTETTTGVAAVEVAASVEPASRGPLEDKWGIHVVRVVATETSGVEVQYSVVAAEKTALLADGRTTGYLVDKATGQKILLGPPEGGSSSAHSRARSRALSMWQAGGFPPPPSRTVQGKVYSILLPNPGGIVKRGREVSVVIGDVRTRGLTVE